MIFLRFFLFGVAIAGIGFLVYYKFFWHKRILKKETVDLLRRNGIGERPETIIRNYYKMQGRILEEKEVKSLTNQYMQNNQEFFLTMWENCKPKKERQEP